MFGFAFILYFLFLLGYGVFLWAVFWHLRAYRSSESRTERVSTALVALIGVLLFVSFLLFFRVPWQSYSLFPRFPL